MRSSWAGAMGPVQFLPSDFYRFAVDFDGDGKADVWNSLPDALASAAQQLVEYGWERDKPWGFEVVARTMPDCTLAQPKLKRPLKEWLADGYSVVGQTLNSWLEEPAVLVMPAGTLGPAVLGLRNYDALRSYNQSDLYVLFVGNLADRIQGLGPFTGRWRPAAAMPAGDVERLQMRLAALGLCNGNADGQAGPLTRAAVGTYQKANGLDLTCWPGPELLAHLERRGPALPRGRQVP